jgi:hypothetical protein
MKLGASYNLFDGEELIEKSILSIRDNVDYISVVFQTESNFGNPANEKITDILVELLRSGLVNEVVHYAPDISRHPHQNELRKRNVGLDLSIENGCTHHLSIDADEFYDKEEFRTAKNRIQEGGYDSSVCRLLTYYHDCHTVLDPMENYFVSFIFRIREGVYYDIIPFPVLVDPTRRMTPGNLLILEPSGLIMHHFSYVRESLLSKLQNSSAKENWNEEMMEKVIQHFSVWQPGMDALLAPATVYQTKQIKAKFDVF